MTDTQKLKYDLALNCAIAKVLSRDDVVTDEDFLREILEEFKEFYRGYNTTPTRS